MTIRLYTTTSPQRKIYKTFEPLTKSYDIAFKETENISTPKVVLKYGTNLKRYNYANIPVLNRWYWIEQVDEVVGGLCTLSLRIDVLYPYKEYCREVPNHQDRKVCSQ